MRMRSLAVVCAAATVMTVAIVLYWQFVEPALAVKRAQGQGPDWFTMLCSTLIVPGMLLGYWVLPADYTVMCPSCPPPHHNLVVWGTGAALNIVFWTATILVAEAVFRRVRKRPRMNI